MGGAWHMVPAPAPSMAVPVPLPLPLPALCLTHDSQRDSVRNGPGMGWREGGQREGAPPPPGSGGRWPGLLCASVAALLHLRGLVGRARLLPETLAS